MNSGAARSKAWGEVAEKGAIFPYPAPRSNAYHKTVKAIEGKAQSIAVKMSTNPTYRNVRS